MTRRNGNLYIEDDIDDDQVIWASGSADPNNISVGISKILYEHREATVRCIGAGAVNQAVKAIAISRGFVAQKGYDLIVRPGFINVPAPSDMNVSTVSAIAFRITVE